MIAGLKGSFPFRLGAPSFVLPADILPNVRHLAPFVDDIEIVIFESDAIAPLPAPAVIDELIALAREHTLTYTVHLPLDADLGTSDETERTQSLGKMMRVIEHTHRLTPHAFILHFPVQHQPQARWHAALSCSIEQLLEGAGIPPDHVCIENLDYPFETITPIIEQYDLGICLDLGHAINHGVPVRPLLAAHIQRARVIHLHGVDETRDHRALTKADAGRIRKLVETLEANSDTPRVLTLEIFNAERLRKSMELLKGLTTQ